MHAGFFVVCAGDNLHVNFLGEIAIFNLQKKGHSND